MNGLVGQLNDRLRWSYIQGDKGDRLLRTPGLGPAAGPKSKDGDSRPCGSANGASQEESD
jgi:hypothetical protein